MYYEQGLKQMGYMESTLILRPQLVSDAPANEKQALNLADLKNDFYARKFMRKNNKCNS